MYLARFAAAAPTAFNFRTQLETGARRRLRTQRPDHLTRAYFNGASTVTMDEATERVLPIPRRRIPWLVGALDGSTITVQHDKDGHSFVFTVVHYLLEQSMIRILWQDPEDGRLYLMWNEAFRLKQGAQRRGFGTRSIAIELREIARLGIQCIGCRAAGPADGQIGYYAWPLIGFDAELEARDMAQLPPRLAHCRTLTDLFMEPGGADHWRRFGRSMTVFFDLAPGSGSWSILSAYLEKRGITL